MDINTVQSFFKKNTVRLGDLITEDYLKDGLPLNAILGVDSEGKTVYGDIASWPHAIISGASGSGKSVLMHTILASLLCKNTKEDLRLILTDPKMIEMAPYHDIPNLAAEVLTDAFLSGEAVKWLKGEMERRYYAFLETKSRNIREYNEKSEVKMPRLLLVMNEVNETIMQAGEEFEENLTTILQKGRASGIHVILIEARIKPHIMKKQILDNAPVRIAFRTVCREDSRIILGCEGAEKLERRGEMLYKNGDEIIRLEGALTPYEELTDFTDSLREKGKPEYLFDVWKNFPAVKPLSTEKKEFLYEIARFCIVRDSCTINGIQTEFGLGFNRTSRIVNTLEDLGIVSKKQGLSRTILVKEEDLPRMLSAYHEEAPEAEIIISTPKDPESEDEGFLYEVAKYCVEENICSINTIQSKFSIGFNRASRIVNILEDRGIASHKEGRNPRTILVTLDQLNEMFKNAIK